MIFNSIVKLGNYCLNFSICAMHIQIWRKNVFGILVLAIMQKRIWSVHWEGRGCRVRVSIIYINNFFGWVIFSRFCPIVWLNCRQGSKRVGTLRSGGGGERGRSGVVVDSIDGLHEAWRCVCWFLVNFTDSGDWLTDEQTDRLTRYLMKSNHILI